MRVRLALSLTGLLAVGAMITLVACSGGTSNNGPSRGGSSTGTVTTTVSDPSTCSAPQGPFSNVFVTVADVQIHQSATAAATDSGWQDLTPGLTPTQIDLLGIANNSCFLASLGSNVAIQAGTYQQVRVILLDNSKASQVANNKCGTNAANCVVLAAGNTVQPLALSSESQTGIKIPPGQLAGGQFIVAAGQAKDLNIDFNACASIVVQGNGQFRLKPVLHAGEVSTTSSSITGKVVDSVTRATVVGGKVVVALEQLDANGVDRVVMETVPDSSGNFVFCPVPAGTYDVVAIGINGQGVAYGATVTTGVQPGNALNQVPIIAQTGTTSPATITGLVTASTASNTGASADVSLSTLQGITVGSNNVFVTVPQAATSSATLSLATVAGASCPANTQCATYSVQVPAQNPSVGAFSASGTSYSTPSGAVNYTLDALAFVPGSGNTPNCTPSEQKSATPLTVTAGSTVNAPNLAFTGCQ